jgi:hypothetical protein
MPAPMGAAIGVSAIERQSIIDSLSDGGYCECSIRSM